MAFHRRAGQGRPDQGQSQRACHQWRAAARTCSRWRRRHHATNVHRRLRTRARDACARSDGLPNPRTQFIRCVPQPPPPLEQGVCVFIDEIVSAIGEQRAWERWAR